jgi:DNA topoisomerase-1
MSDQTQQAYCVKCRTRRTMINPTAVFTAGGTPGTSGQCEVCGTKMFRMGATDAHASLPKPTVTKTTSKKSTAKSGKKAATSKSKAASKTGAKALTGTATKQAAGKKATSKSGKASKGKKSPAVDKKPARRRGRLVIVESPAKARSVGRFLGEGYTVRASKGHVRDLLKSQLSVDVNNGFEPKYRVPNDKRDTIKELQRAVDHAEEIFLATDPDREGEAIAWHLIAATEMPEDRIKRVVFHEITDEAVHHAFAQPRDVDMNLVNAQQARRILDRIVGYTVTELLWDKVRNRLSAGRVQSIALRMVVDREREIEAFKAEEYWTVDAELLKQAGNGKNGQRPFVAHLTKYKGHNVNFKAKADVTPHLEVLERSQYVITDVKVGTRQRRPSPPFTTSTLQQEASRRLGFNAQRTMRTAQQLYEGIDLGRDGLVGVITYMRTDSTNISKQAQQEARKYIGDRFGKDSVPKSPPHYQTKTKGAQEAHEAIRPTSVFRTPASLKDTLSRDQLKLYTLIWERFVASQMANAVYDTLRVEIAAGPERAHMPYGFRANGSTIKFAGFLALYEETRDDDAVVDEDEGRILPNLSVDEVLNLVKLLPQQHFTQPPPRYTEATLVKALEENGIGRPSTYAATLEVIKERDYVTQQDRRMVPTETGRIVNDLLVTHFPELMDYQFTARLEDQLDTIADGGMEWRPMLGEFYGPFEQQLRHARTSMPSVQQEEYVGRGCPTCEEGQLVVKYGRWGKFIGCSRYPDCKHTEPFLERTGHACPTCGPTEGGELVARKTRKGRTFYGCSRYPACDYSTWRLPRRSKKGGKEEEEHEESLESAS